MRSPRPLIAVTLAWLLIVPVAAAAQAPAAPTQEAAAQTAAEAFVEGGPHYVAAAALAEALRGGHLGGAAIDVFGSEPLPASAHFTDCQNLLLTPHIAGVSAESNERVSFLIAEKVLEALA